jgi:HD-like signal output (HDOD) protein
MHGKKKIGELLVEAGYVTQEQVQQALEVQKTKKERICNVLMDLGYLSEERFMEFLSAIPGIATIELARYQIDQNLLNLVPGDLALRLEAVPIGKIGNLLTVAMVCPIDQKGREQLEEVTGLKVKPVLCSPHSVSKALDVYYKKPSVDSSPVPEAQTDISAIAAPLKLRGVAKLVEEIEELPTLPDIANTISLIVNDPNSSATDLARVISTDGALSAKILKLANSPAFGFSRRILDIKHAVALLGYKETQDLALSVSVFNYLVDNADFDFKTYWNHSFACATLAKLIAMSVKNTQGLESAFVAGLLHDVGKVILAMSTRGTRQKAESLYGNSHRVSREMEEELLGTTHAEIGYLLGEHWLLPSTLTNAIRYHHSPELEPEPKGLSSIIYLADVFCQTETPKPETNIVFDDKVLALLKNLNISEVSFSKTLEVYSNIACEIAIF